MENTPLLIRGGRLIDPSQGLDGQADLLIADGKVAWIAPSAERRAPPDGATVLEAKEFVVCPGFVDIHVHLREPGYEDKETIATGTLAAARGGFTTVCAMANTLPAIDSAAVVEFVLRKAREAGHARVLTFGCITKGRKGRELAELAELAEAGAIGFSDDGDPVTDPFVMRMALMYSAITGLPMVNHAEDPGLARGGVLHEGWVASRLGLRGAPAESEEAMVARDIELAALTGGRLHLAHITTGGTVELLHRAKERGLRVTAEVTPHHLVLTEEWALGRHGEGSPFGPLSPDAYDTCCRVNPPLRTRRDAAALVAALREGVIDAVATDHAPHTVVDKACTFDETAAGISGLETALGLLMALVQRGDITLNTLVERLTTGPARVLGERGRGLGTLRPGSAADVTIIDPEARWVVDTAQFASKGKNTPLEGVKLKGKVVCTLLGGRTTYSDLGPSLKAAPSPGGEG